MFRSILLILVIFAIIAGCQQPSQSEVTDIDHAVDLLKSLQDTNVVSSPLNPYALPIGGVLTGIIAMLESLRRVEKGKRKYAEHELNNNNKNST